MIDVINYHITNVCNYRCQYCFVGFREREPEKETALKIVEKIHEFFIENGVKGGRINIAGGEPLLYPHLNDVIEHANSLGLKVSIITNGSLLTEKMISNWKGGVQTIGISIDAISEEVNCTIGREHKGTSLSDGQLFSICDCIHKNGIKLKINTVVSKLNLGENMLAVYQRINPDRLKFLCMHVLDNINSAASNLKPTNEEFMQFVAKNRYRKTSEFIIEPEGTMQNSYVMISPCGNVFLNEDGEGRTYGNCLVQNLCEIYRALPLDSEKYKLRY